MPSRWHIPPAYVRESYRATHRARAVLRHILTSTSRRTPALLRLPFESLWLHTADGFRLDAWFVPPSAAESPLATATARARVGVVIHHHYGGGKATTLPWIALFARLGHPVIAFDARGHGRSTALAGQTDSFVARAADVTAACAALRQRGADRLVGFGQSQGAAALIIAMARREDLLAVVLDSGPAPGMGPASFGLARFLCRTAAATNAEDGVVAPNRLASLLLTAHLYATVDPLRYLAALWPSLFRLRQRHTPLLWMHGDADDVIARPWSQLWFRLLAPQNGLWRALALADSGHCRGIKTHRARVEQAVTAFIGQTIDDAAKGGRP